jgi:hypothetical protein
VIRRKDVTTSNRLKTGMKRSCSDRSRYGLPKVRLMVVSVSCDVVTPVSCRWLSLSERVTASRISSVIEAVSSRGPPLA